MNEEILARIEARMWVPADPVEGGPYFDTTNGEYVKAWVRNELVGDGFLTSVSLSQTADVPALVAALREAWAERDDALDNLDDERVILGDALRERDDARAEVERLVEWKDSAITVLSDWEAVFDALGQPGPLGASKAQNARAEVERLTADRDGWESLAERLALPEKYHARLAEADAACAALARVEALCDDRNSHLAALGSYVSKDAIRAALAGPTPTEGGAE